MVCQRGLETRETARGNEPFSINHVIIFTMRHALGKGRPKLSALSSPYNSVVKRAKPVIVCGLVSARLKSAYPPQSGYHNL
jgi:hypothetical protein